MSFFLQQLNSPPGLASPPMIRSPTRSMSPPSPPPSPASEAEEEQSVLYHQRAILNGRAVGRRMRYIKNGEFYTN